LSIAVVIAGSLGIVTGGTSHATIHEIVAAYCSGGDVGVIGDDGFLEPPGISDPSNQQTFARPVVASGAATGPDAEGIISISDKPNTKFPAGTPIVDVIPAPEPLLVVSQSDHPSAEHCPKAVDLP
jgi:hypothetical protein